VIAPDGTIYVADYGNSRVQVFDSQFRFLRQWNHPPGHSVMSLALNAAGDNLYMTSFEGTLLAPLRIPCELDGHSTILAHGL